MNREAFEKVYADAHDLPLETFSQYRMGDTYRHPGIASHWRTWVAASGEVEKLLARDAEHIRQFNELSDFRQKTVEAFDKKVATLEAENEAMRKDAERYRWLRDEAGSADWEHIGYQSEESRDKHIDDYRGHAE